MSYLVLSCLERGWQGKEGRKGGREEGRERRRQVDFHLNVILAALHWKIRIKPLKETMGVAGALFDL